jgi:hypothetical protein
MASQRPKVLGKKRRLATPIVAAIANHSNALDVTNLGIRSLNVLKKRKGIWPMLVQQEEELW